MNIEQFASITRNIIRANGFEEFQPTVCLPARRDVRSLAGVPEDESHELIALRWAAGIAEPDEEYLVAFRHSPTEFKVVHFVPGGQVHQVYVADASSYVDSAPKTRS
jgi:hypothetical protein